MNRKLVSKIQFKYFEEGEYDLEEWRTLEETIILLKSFPWEEQRYLTPVGLFGPSITIERDVKIFLKIGIYYHNKFVIYYLNENGELYNEVIEQFDEISNFIQDFYLGKDFANSFIKTRMRKRLKKFETKNFEYQVNWKRSLGFWYLNLFMTLFFCLIILADSKDILRIIFFIVCFQLIISSVNIFLFLNYYFFDRHHYFKASRGNDVFYFGQRDDVKEYNKQDIEIIKLTSVDYRSRAPWNIFSYIEIHFKNRECIKFTNLLISDITIMYKFNPIPFSFANKFIPYIKT